MRAQYKEFFVVLAAEYQGDLVTRCPFMWVDQGMPLVRGLVQGFPKKPGSIWMTRPVTSGRPARGSSAAADSARASRRMTGGLRRPR